MFVMEEAGRLAAEPMKDDDSGRETTFASRNIRKCRNVQIALNPQVQSNWI